MKCKEAFGFIVHVTCLATVLTLVGEGSVFGVSFQGLGHLGTNASASSSAAAISGDGSTVVGSTTGGGSGRAFVWTRAGGMRPLQVLAGYTHSQATDVSADGSIIVGSCAASIRQQACLWTAPDEVIGLGQLTASNTAISRAYAVSQDGNVVVGEYLDGGPIAFRWDRGTGMVSLGDFPGGLRQSSAYDVSADGSVVVGYGISQGGLYGHLQAFRWSANTGMVGLGDLPGGQTLSEATAISRDGRNIIVGVSSSTDDPYESEAFSWTLTGGMVGLGDLPGGLLASSATAVSADGSVVVGYGTSESFTEAVVWDPLQGIRAIGEFLASAGVDLSGWSLSEATDVSADGTTVVGNGNNPEGKPEAWIAVLRDEEPPVIVATAAHPAALWPPNNQMVTVRLTAAVEDNFGHATWRITHVRSNEPVSNGDVEVVSQNELRLRAARWGRGSGRIYSIFIQAEDSAHNLSAIRAVQVVVPHDGRRP